jgi:glycosyltransferase involved in cell wall biosynthesis
MSAEARAPGARPTVSVVTPSLNQGRFIGATLHSVVEQDYPGLEHQVIDGGSKDETLAVLRAAARPSLAWVSENDRGQAHALNKGIARTSGEIIAWINSDDVYYPGAISAAAGFLEQHPQVDVVYGAADHIDESGAVLADYPTEPFDLERLSEVCFICQPAAFFRRSCVTRYGPFDERLHYCMDYEFWLRLARAGATFAYLPVKLAGSRLHKDAKTLSARVAIQRETIEMFRRLEGRVPEHWLLDYAHAEASARVDRTRHPWAFYARAGALALYAYLRWPHRASPALRRDLRARFRARLLGALRG